MLQGLFKFAQCLNMQQEKYLYNIIIYNYAEVMQLKIQYMLGESLSDNNNNVP